MSRKREPTEEERALFEAALKDAAPVKSPKPKTTAQPKRDRAPKLPSVSGPTGVDGRTAGRLKRGMLEPEARLDLHGMTEAVAHRALATFIRAAAVRGHRLVLVVTGKGVKPADPYAPFDLEAGQRRRGVLKSLAPRWLAEPELARFVADIRTAHRRHGGEGALYVYLRKQ